MKKHVAMGCLTLLMAASAFAAKPGGSAKRELTYPGLPGITYVSDSDGLLSEVRMGGKQIVSYDWSEEPYAVPARFFNRWSIDTSVMPDGSGTQQVIDPAGRQNGSSVILAHARQLGRPTMLLDALAADLGLAPGWEAGQDVISVNDVRLQANGKTINIKFHSVGQGVRVGESEGTAVLWDLDLPLGLKGMLGQIVPSRLIVTSSGSVHLAADSRTMGAFDGIWTNDPSGERITLRKQLDALATPAVRTAASPVTITAAAAAGTSAIHTRETGVHAEMMWVCGMTMYWISWTDSAGNWYYETRYSPTYCDSGGGGGCLVSGLDQSASSVHPVTALFCGGDSGGGGGSNNQISDVVFQAALNNAKGDATAKLQSAQCQAVIRNNKNAAGISLWTVMSSYAYDPGTYLNSQVTFVRGDGVLDTARLIYPCSVSGELAWVVVPGVHTVNVCGELSTVTSGKAGATLIHEMLHTLGLPENAPDMSSQQITDMVKNACGE